MRYLPGLAEPVAAASRHVAALDAAARAGTILVFGYLGGTPLSFEERFPGRRFVLAFRALPVIVAVSALAALLTCRRVPPLFARGFGRLPERSFRIGGRAGPEGGERGKRPVRERARKARYGPGEGAEVTHP